MNHWKRWIPLGLVLAGQIAGCGTNTQTTTVPQVLACSGDTPYGACPAGKSCLAGACVDTAGLCSPANPTGTCSSGMTCFGGGCVLASALCSATAPGGPCAIGNTCLEGACVATASLCSGSNPTGKCPAGKTCQTGICAAPTVDPCSQVTYTTQPAVAVHQGTGKTIITVDNKMFRDLNGNGKLDPFEDWRLLEICRARDLVGKLSPAEKIGLMSEGGTIGSGTADGTLSQATQDNVVKNHLRQGLIRLGSVTSAQLAVYTNKLQELCEAQPFGIPFIITTDPSHSIQGSTNSATGAFTVSASTVLSNWPTTLGLGAINDAAVTRAYGDMVRKEFMGFGFRWQLGPLADLATEPRWSRVRETFGENAIAVSKHVQACIQGFQADGAGGLKNGIAATMKHFPGHGAEEEGKDAHTTWGKYIVFRAANLSYHQIPFKAAVDVGVAAVMPCYGIFKGQFDIDPLQVGAAYSKPLITDYLKGKLGFDGLVTSDWGVMTNMAWGVEALSLAERAALFIKAGSHQLGNDPYTLVQAAYDQKLVGDSDIDAAATKILELTFKLGMFDNPYVDAAAVPTVIRTKESRRSAFEAQKKAIVMLRNSDHGITQAPPAYLPIDGSRYVDKNGNGMPDIGEYIDDANGDGTIKILFNGQGKSITADVAKPDDVNDVFGDFNYATKGGNNALPITDASGWADADIAVIRIAARVGTRLDRGNPLSFDGAYPGLSTDTSLAPAILDRNKVIDAFRARDGYTKADGTKVAAVNPKLRIVLVMHLSRPGIVRPFIQGLTTLDETPGVPGSYPLVSNEANIRKDGLGGVDAFLVEFGAWDRALLDFLFNANGLPGWKYGQGVLPIEIPSSDAEVNAQYEDLPNDTANPTYRLGAGISYP